MLWVMDNALRGVRMCEAELTNGQSCKSISLNHHVSSLKCPDPGKGGNREIGLWLDAATAIPRNQMSSPYTTAGDFVSSSLRV